MSDKKEIPAYLKEAAEKEYPRTYEIDSVRLDDSLFVVKRECFISGATSPEAARYHQEPVGGKQHFDMTEVVELIKYYVPVRQHAQIVIDKLSGVIEKDKNNECVHPFESLIMTASKATCLRCGKDV